MKELLFTKIEWLHGTYIKPIFIVLFSISMILEFLYAQYKNKNLYNRKESVENFKVALISLVVNSIISSSLIYFMQRIYDDYSIFKNKDLTLFSFSILFILMDFERILVSQNMS